MKKRFISLVAAAALVGGVAAVSTPTVALAGTVAVKGDTKVQMYGFLRYTAGWAKDMSSTATSTNVPDSRKDDTYFASEITKTRLGLNFKNEEANLTGKLEGKFEGKNNSFRTRRIFVEHHLNNFYVLIGKQWGIEEVHTFSYAKNSPAGFNRESKKMPQIQVGTNLDLNGATLGLVLAFEDKDYTGMKKRETMPGIAAKAKLRINTGFGNPAQVYAFGLAEPVKIKDPTDHTGKSEDGETSVVFGAGFSLPISMVTVQSEYIYGKGANKFAGLTAYNDVIPSYYDDNGDVETNKFNAYNIEAKVAPMPNISVAGGYDYVKFTKDLSDVAVEWDKKGNPTEYGFDKPKVETYFGNIAWNTTKYTQLVLEWDHVEGDTGDNDTDLDENGNQYWLRYTYYF